MKLVIDIPEEDYEGLKKKDKFNDMYLNHYEKLIVHGIPLPKGQGRLITEPTEEDIAKTVGGKNDFADCIREAVKTVFANAPTIIEAESEE